MTYMLLFNLLDYYIYAIGITYGWKATLEKYQKSYPDKAAMGVLFFGDIKITSLSRKLILVTGSWELKRVNDELSRNIFFEKHEIKVVLEELSKMENE